MTDKKPDLSLCLFKFVVRASEWDDAAKILKDTLGIDATHDASDRKVSDMYLVSSWVSEDLLTKDFYSKISTSSDIAVHSDTKSSSLYPKILKETQIVEERLRWLLLHVSDAIEDYAKHVKSKDGEVIGNKSLDPVTSKLSFESMIAILEIDLSWAGQGVDVEKIDQAINDTTDYESLKEMIRNEATPKIIWDSISELVLEKPVKWSTLKTKIMKIKKFRNDCAHFHTVTDDNLNQAQILRQQIMRSLTKKKTYTPADMTAFAGLNKQLAETMKRISSQLVDIQPIANSALAAQKAMLENLKLNTGLMDSLKVSETMAKRFFENSNLDAVLRAQTAALVPPSKINFPALNLSQSTIDSISRARRALGSMDTVSQDDVGSDPIDTSDKDTDDGAANDQQSADDDSQPPKSSPNSKKGKKK